MIRRATRFFARLTAGHLECPACGHVFSFGSGRSAWDHGKSKGWHAQTSRFTCTHCQRGFVLGMLAWPVRGGDSRYHGRPQDQVPNPRQAAELRQWIGGYWMPEEEKRGRKDDLPTNLVVGECTCVEESPEGIRVRRKADCPVHGDPDVSEQEQDEEDEP